MKIGILTFHDAKNYGAILQAFALINIIKKLGHTPVIINRLNKKSKFKRFVILIHFIKSIITLDFIRWYSFVKFNESIIAPKTRKYNDVAINKFDEFENFDCCIVGSDQVWRLGYSAIGLNYFFDFIKRNKTRKISYAASFGLEEWGEDAAVTNKIKTCLTKFKYISVREESGVKICNNIFNVPATLVLDPTLLLTKNEYIELFQLDGLENPSDNIIATYIIGKNESDYKTCKKFAKENNLKRKNLYYNSLNILKVLHEKQFICYDVKEWLNIIAKSKYVITNSYHGAIFSIIFEKQFIVLNNKTAGITRLRSLFNILNLNDRLFENSADISKNELEKPINYSYVNEILNEQRKHSLSFLKKSIL
jgi:hypothetical protein